MMHKPMGYSCCSSALHSSAPCDPDHGTYIVEQRPDGSFKIIKGCESGSVPDDVNDAFNRQFPSLAPQVGQCYALCCEPSSSSSSSSA